MSGLLGDLEHFGSSFMGDVGNTQVGRENLEEVFANLTLISLVFNFFKEHVVKGRSSFDEEYDYIIIGGGTAGSIMASRLSQHPCVKVLLLEAGGEQPTLTHIPGFARAFLDTSIDWSYYTTPQKYCSYGQKENKVLWNSGRCLGGGSTLNAMAAVRGNKKNYDQWAAEGAVGWSYEEVLPYFLKLEDNQDMKAEDIEKAYHSTGGPMGFQKSNWQSPLREHATEALKGLGYRLNDVNGHQQFGIYDLQATMRHQERCSTSTGYLKPSSKRHNLHIVTNAFVRKVLINRRQGNRATGVLFDHGNKTHIVRIKWNPDGLWNGYGEVIVSNGAARSPQTLMLSGIGPRAHLEEFGIPVISDLPGVGKNLMDHNAAGMLYEIDPMYRNVLGKQISPENMAAYIFAKQGPLCSISQINLLAFLDGVNNTNPGRDFPQQQLFFLDYNTLDAVRTLNLVDDIREKVFNPYLLSPVVFCFAQLLQPYSRGEILLTSIDPHEYPHINPNYYQDPRDVYHVVQGMKLCNQVIYHPEMQKMKAKWADTQKYNYPGCENLQGNEDAYLECIARSVVLTIWHPCCTCRMGDPRDPRSVVDPQLRVIGVNNLRVINAAVMPMITSGNTNVPTMMIAEKAYDMMKGDIKCNSAYTIRGSHQVHDSG